MILTDGTHAVMDRKEFDGLPEYSCLLPTGVVVGRRWKRRVPYAPDDEVLGWLLGEYYADPNYQDGVGVRFLDIIVV